MSHLRRTTTFTHGTGCYSCRCCGRKTRDDGRGDSVNVRLCSECFELAGLENEIQDGHATDETHIRIAQLRIVITNKGGAL